MKIITEVLNSKQVEQRINRIAFQIYEDNFNEPDSLNKWINFFHINIPNQAFFSSYECWRMSSKRLHKAQARAWLTVMKTQLKFNKILTISEPWNYKEAIKLINQKHWLVIMNNKYKILIKCNTWILVSRS